MKFKKFKHLKMYGDLSNKYYKGSIECSARYLNSLEGAPKWVSLDFWCNTNYLETLKGGPVFTGDSFHCSYNEIITLEGAPQYVGQTFNCSGNKYLESLEGAPQYVSESFNCTICPELESLQGAPEYVGGFFECDKKLKQGDNLYIIVNALLNGYKNRKGYTLEKVFLKILERYF